MDSVRKDSQNFLHPSDCCYKAKPCDGSDPDARMVVRLHDYQTAYERIVMLQSGSPSPPPDVVEAARRLRTDFANMLDIEVVCEWVLSQK